MTYVDHLLNLMQTDTEAEFLVDRTTRLTRGQARDRLLRISDGLHNRGIRQGDGVGVAGGNTVDTALTSIAVHLLGGRLVFVPPEPGAKERAALVEKAQVKLTVTDDDRIEGEPIEREGKEGFQTVFYTGGTTGSPKLATHGSGMYGVLPHMAAAGEPTNALIGTLITHGSGHVNTLVAMIRGSKVVLGPAPFDAGEFIRLVDEEAITATVLVPPMLLEVLDHPDCPAKGVLQRVNTGGSPLAPRRFKQAIERWGDVIFMGYGMSEALGISSLQPQDITSEERLASAGRPFGELKIENGEIFVRGGALMIGYWGEPPVEGWFNTGDMGYLDDDGFLYLTDRSKDVIVTGRTSDNVYSKLLDDFLVTLPGIKDAAAVGEPDETFGEVVHVFVVPQPGHEVDTERLIKSVVTELGELYEPRGVTVLDRLPSTRVGKVDKTALRSTLS